MFSNNFHILYETNIDIHDVEISNSACVSHAMPLKECTMFGTNCKADLRFPVQ